MSTSLIWISVLNLCHYINYSRLPILMRGCLLHRAKLLILILWLFLYPLDELLYMDFGILLINKSWSCSLRVRCVPCSLVLKVVLVPPSLLRSSNVPSSFWSVFQCLSWHSFIHSFIHLFHIPLILYRCETSHLYIYHNK